jgi:hypothetical protein
MNAPLRSAPQAGSDGRQTPSPPAPLTTLKSIIGKASIGALLVLVARDATHSNSASDISVHHDWEAARGCEGSWQRSCCRPGVDGLHEGARRAPVSRSRSRFADRNIHAGRLRVLHTLKVYQETMRIDDCYSYVPAVILALLDDFGSDLLRSVDIDRWSVIGPLLGIAAAIV